MDIKNNTANIIIGDFPGVQWLRIRLPMQRTWVRSLVWEDPTGHGTANTICPNYRACALEPGKLNAESPGPRAWALHQERLLR